jgi:hypothetical protein
MIQEADEIYVENEFIVQLASIYNTRYHGYHAARMHTKGPLSASVTFNVENEA